MIETGQYFRVFVIVKINMLFHCVNSYQMFNHINYVHVANVRFV